jgi:hypothetical protein
MGVLFKKRAYNGKVFRAKASGDRDAEPVQAVKKITQLGGIENLSPAAAHIEQYRRNQPVICLEPAGEFVWVVFDELHGVCAYLQNDFLEGIFLNVFFNGKRVGPCDIQLKTMHEGSAETLEGFKFGEQIVDLLGVWYLLAQVIAAGLIAISSFFVYRHFIFKIPV